MDRSEEIAAWFDQYPLGDDEMLALGRIAALGSLIDGVAQSILAVLVSRVDRAEVLALTDGETATWRLQKITHINDRKEEPDLALGAWVKQAGKALALRNEFVHSAWLLRLEHIEKSVAHRSKRSGVVFDFRSPADFDDAVGDLWLVHQVGIGIANEIGAGLPTDTVGEP